ncbi:hypothetical protein LPJ56_006802, partial [Coemansia sp. RSA 2599]
HQRSSSTDNPRLTRARLSSSQLESQASSNAAYTSDPNIYATTPLASGNSAYARGSVTPAFRKRKLDCSPEPMREASERPMGGTVFSAAAGSVVSEGSTIELVGQVQRVELLGFLKEQARVREQREAARAEERRHAEQIRDEEEMRFHEFQMSLISLIKNSLVQPESRQDSPAVMEPADAREVDVGIKTEDGDGPVLVPMGRSISAVEVSKPSDSEDGEVSEEIEMYSRTSTPANAGACD